MPAQQLDERESFQHELDVQHVAHQEFIRLRRSLAFDKGLWIRGALLPEGPVVHLMCKFNGEYSRLVQGACRTWPMYLPIDPLSINKTTIFCELSAEARMKTTVSTLYTVDVARHTNLINVIALHRFRDSPYFTEADKQFEQSITGSFFRTLNDCLALSVRQSITQRWRDLNSIASCTPNGIVYDVENSFVDRLRKEWPGWTGPMLPKVLLRLLDGPARSFWIGGKVIVRRLGYNTGSLLFISDLGKCACLTGRERQVAALYANGLNYRQIATYICIAMSTVRNHLASIYMKLGVSNKSALVSTLEAAPLDDIDSYLSQGRSTREKYCVATG